MGEIRAPAVAGTFYPLQPEALQARVRGYIQNARSAAAAKAIVAPHAGYVYSGPVAGNAFSAFSALRGKVSRVVLIGPAHRAAFTGLALPQARAFATPLGILPIDEDGRNALMELPSVIASDRAHAGEHSLEVELPFIQEVLGEVLLLPIVVGDATDKEAAHVLERVWGGPETCIVVSSDLSHYYPYATAQQLDQATALAVEHLRPEQIDEERACGCIGLRALLLVARERGLRCTTLDLRNSGDTVGARDRVVGYGAFSFA